MVSTRNVKNCNLYLSVFKKLEFGNCFVRSWTQFIYAVKVFKLLFMVTAYRNDGCFMTN